MKITLNLTVVELRQALKTLKVIEVYQEALAGALGNVADEFKNDDDRHIILSKVCGQDWEHAHKVLDVNTLLENLIEAKGLKI